MSDNKSESVKVGVRIRPLNKNEQAENAVSVITTSGNTVCITDPITTTSKTFGFDYTFGKEVSNADIYNSIGKDIVQSAIAGYNCCILAYGQTGSGKTYTMLNYDKCPENLNSELGLIPHIASELLNIVASNNSPNIEYHLEVSFVEIYAEKIFDLLSESKHASLRLHINPKIGTYIEGLNSIAVTDIGQVMKLIEKGFKHRSTSSTAMNEQSSRSHAIFNISFKQINYSPFLDETRKIISEKISKIKLVDLAGSERVKTSKVSGVNFQEAIAINKSLSMLSTVINELVENGSSTKFRNSILTALLADSISGNSKTVIIANVSPASIAYDISLQTLFYVHRTKKIKCVAKINEITSEESQSIIHELKVEIERLKAELLKATDVEEIKKLKEDLAEYERLYKENSASWSDKLKCSQESIANLEIELARRNSMIVEIKQRSDDAKKTIDDEIKEMQNVLDTLQTEKVELTQSIRDLSIEKLQLLEERDILNQNLIELHNHFNIEKQRYIDKLTMMNRIFIKK